MGDALSKWKPTCETASRLTFEFLVTLQSFISGRFLAGKGSAKGLGTSFQWSNDGQMVVFLRFSEPDCSDDH